MASVTKAPIVELTPDLNKIVESILLVLKKAAERGKSVTQYDIVKTIFLADRLHLNEYGRPITFDNYFAMKDGPVPTKVYDLVKGGPWAERLIGGELPWTTTPAPGTARAKLFKATLDPAEDVFSPSEIEAIENSLTVVLSLGFSQVRRLTHEDPSYVDAWGGDETTRYPMSLGLLFDEPNFELAEDLQYLSQFGSH
ncbi:Panacea domain-containing protein [Devosia indica]